MKNERKFFASSVVTVALAIAAIFGSAVPATAQTNSAAPGAQTRYGQETVPSTPPTTPAFRTLVNFNGGNGTDPQGTQFTEGIDGNLYGAVSLGGQYGHGLLFKFTPGGTVTPLYNFCPQAGCADGSRPTDLLLGMDMAIFVAQRSTAERSAMAPSSGLPEKIPRSHCIASTIRTVPDSPT